MEPSFPIHLIKDACVGCGTCVDACAYNAIQLEDYPEIDATACTLCGSCVRACSSEALVMDQTDKSADATATPETHGIWVLAEVEDGRLAPVTLELVSKAHDLAAIRPQSVEVALIGNGVAHLADTLFQYGADKVHLVESEDLSHFVEENYALVLVRLCKKCHPNILLVGATPKGRGLSARMASMLHTGLTADCTQLEIDPETGLLQQKRPAFGGNLMATIITPNHRPQTASVRPGVMHAQPLEHPTGGEVIRHDFQQTDIDRRIEVISETAERSAGDTLEGSKIVVGIGRGVKSRELVSQIKAWADSLHATLAGSRAAVEAGLIDAHLQVGQTGHTISPELYIAIGISGQIQHLAGVSGARKVVVINPDRNAPIYRIADYGFPYTVEEFLRGLQTR